MASFGSQLLLLGLKSVHVLTLRTWIERLDLLAKQKMFPEALSLALSFYEDSAKAVTGISGKRPQRQQLVAAKMSDLLEAYVDVIMTQLCPERGRVEHLVQHYRETVPRVVYFCLAIRKRYSKILKLLDLIYLNLDFFSGISYLGKHTRN